MEARVVRISISPVKSLGLVHPNGVDLVLGGVVGDRRFWMVDEDGRLFNNKRNGPMVTIHPEWDEATGSLVLEFPDGRRVEGTVELGEPIEIELYGVLHPSRRVLGPWAEALSDHIGRRVTLLWSEDHATDRGVRGGTVSLVSRASLERLAEQAGAAAPLDGRRFRMLFEIDGVAPHEEDEWIGSHVELGGATVVVNGDVGRCLVTSHDPDRGVTDVDTLRALASYRRDGRSEPLPLGVYGAVARAGRVEVGDVVRPAARTSSSERAARPGRLVRRSRSGPPTHDDVSAFVLDRLRDDPLAAVPPQGVADLRHLGAEREFPLSVGEANGHER